MAPIAAAHHRKFEPRARKSLAHLHQQRVCARLRLNHCEAGRTPGGLTYAGNALRLEPGQHRADRCTGEATALRLRKVIADRALNLADRGTESRAVLLN